MASGACVIVYEGKKGRVFYIKYRDAAGVQVKEKLGRESDGWTRRKAERALGVALDKVENEGMTKPKRETFAHLAVRFESEYLPGRNLKRTTLSAYESTLRLYLRPYFDNHRLTELEARPELVDRYIAAKTAEGLAPKTIVNHLLLLNSMFSRAIRWKLMRTNPVDGADRPRLGDTEWGILTESEIARLLAAFDELESEADDEKKPWWRIAKRLVVFGIATGFRRGELLGLTWRYVDFLDKLARVEKTWVRNAWDTPKSKKSYRTVEMGGHALAAIEAQWRESLYRDDDSVVFGHPQTGAPLEPSKLANLYLKPALKRAGITKRFRSFHDMRHTSLTHEAAAGNPQAYVQLKAGHSQGSITEKYIHAAQVLFPGAAEKGEARMFGAPTTPGEHEHEADSDPRST